MNEHSQDDQLEDDATVLDDDEGVEDPPAEDELASAYDGEREGEPAGEEEIDDVEAEANPENPDEPLIPPDIPAGDAVEQ